MKPNSNWRKMLCAALFVALFATISVQAQFPGFGGTGNTGGSRSSRSGSGSTSSSAQYPRNGDVGDAVISIDPETRNLIVVADDETLIYLSQVVSNLDRPQPQVLIKVVFVEVSRDAGLDFGVEGTFNKPYGNSWNSGLQTNYSVLPIFGTVGSNVVQTGSSIVPSAISPVFTPSSVSGSSVSGLAGLAGAGTGGLYQIMGQDYTVTLHAIATAGKAKILSRPSVIARNNQPAQIVVGQKVPLITSVRYDTFGNAINGIQYTDVGIILRVTPYITGDGLVQMILAPETSAVSPTGGTVISSGPGGLNPVVAPYIDERSADTVVVTPDGQTVIIGGLIYDQKAEAESKIPFIGDIPILGNFFKRKVKTEDKKELLIFLTPHVIAAPSQYAGVTATERARSDALKGLTDQELDKFLDTIPKKPAKNGSKKTLPLSSQPPTLLPDTTK